jgi:hypothetical protein
MRGGVFLVSGSAGVSPAAASVSLAAFPWPSRLGGTPSPATGTVALPETALYTSLKLTLDYHLLHKDYELNKMQTR